MKHYLPDMELSDNARLRPVVKTPDVAPSSKLRKAMSGKPGGFVRQAGNAVIAENAGNDGAGNGYITGTSGSKWGYCVRHGKSLRINSGPLLFTAIPAFTALTAF
jgi:hypothetical protein